MGVQATMKAEELELKGFQITHEKHVTYDYFDEDYYETYGTYPESGVWNQLVATSPNGVVFHSISVEPDVLMFDCKHVNQEFLKELDDCGVVYYKG